MTQKVGFAVSMIVFLVFFEWMRRVGNFEIRTGFMCITASIFYVWQIYEVKKKRRMESSSQLAYLQYASSAELFFAIGRLTILVISSLVIRQVEQIPQVLILFTITQLVMNTLSYIAIGSYWAEQIAKSNARSQLENEEIKTLLQERESLIASLLRANKTASTGALSASIAHELNQPLGASSLNIQFLQKKLAEGELNPTLQKEVLDTLLSDNQRAAAIINSLRSIFSDEDLSYTKIDIGEVIESVLSITKPEIASKQIQIALRLEDGLVAIANPGEMRQVLLNLINNAIQSLATSSVANKQITIEGKHLDNGFIRVVIADNGDGVPEETQRHLFELLSSTKQSGMGLGLWLCKHIVTRHGGSIGYESNEVSGAKFVFDLPS